MTGAESTAGPRCEEVSRCQNPSRQGRNWMLHLALAQDITASHLRAARFQQSSDTRVLLQMLRSAPGFLTGGPESDSKLAPQVQSAGQKAKPAPGPSMPQPLCWPGPQSLPHDHPTLTYYPNLRSENQLLFLSSLQRLSAGHAADHAPGLPNSLCKRVWAFL